MVQNKSKIGGNRRINRQVPKKKSKPGSSKQARFKARRTKKPLKFLNHKKSKKKIKVIRRSGQKKDFHFGLGGIKSYFSHLLMFDKEKKPDKVLFGVIIFLIFAGLLMVLDTSLVFAKRDFHNAYHFLILQAGAAVVGFVGFFFAYTIDYRIIRKFIFIFYIVTILLLISTLFTHEVNGARSWISLGGFNLQPSEIAKLTFVLYVSGILSQSRKWNTVSEFIKEDFLPFAIPLGIILLFVLGGKDLGTSIIIGSVALIIYFFKSRTKYEYITCVIMLVVFVLAGVGMIAMEGYRGSRVAVYTNALTKGEIVDEQGTGYQMKQILLALGSGGFSGVGLAESLQKYDLVETTAATDSVIAIIAEEFGFIGAITTLIVFLLFVYRGLWITTYNKDRYGQIVVIGIVAWIGIQVFIHVASNVVVTPLTGVPMPFLSYGGSSLVSVMVASGILLNISKH